MAFVHILNQAHNFLLSDFIFVTRIKFLNSVGHSTTCSFFEEKEE